MYYLTIIQAEMQLIMQKQLMKMMNITYGEPKPEQLNLFE